MGSILRPVSFKLITNHSERVGYLLKDRVADVAQFTAALHHIAHGGSLVDPTLVAELVSAPTAHDPLMHLTPRERDVLTILAEGRTDRGIVQQLYLAPKTVGAHVRAIFSKLDLPANATEKPTHPRRPDLPTSALREDTAT